MAKQKRKRLTVHLTEIGPSGFGHVTYGGQRGGREHAGYGQKSARKRKYLRSGRLKIR